jgi:hypothetical protein
VLAPNFGRAVAEMLDSSRVPVKDSPPSPKISVLILIKARKKL